MHLEHSYYAKKAIPEYIAEIRQTMSKRELFAYKIYCLSPKGIILGNYKRGMGYVKRVDTMKMSKWMWRKDSY